MDITLIPTLSDNYSYLLETEDGAAALVDPGEAGPVIEALEARHIKPNCILCTHHHADHIGGNDELKQKYGCDIVGPAKDSHRIDLDIPLSEGDHFSLGEERAEILETPGHTSGHICFYFPGSKALFCGDTLFSMGCGRLFEGTAEQMWDSLQKIMALPDETKLYAGHEYTVKNAEFCLQVEPENEALKKRYAQARALRAENKPTLPVSLGTEKETNAFLRAGSVDEFARRRTLKDSA